MMANTFHQYLLDNLNSAVMISVSFDDIEESSDYTHWNWFHEKSEFHLLNPNYTIGHIIHTGTFTTNDDGSITHTSKYHPKNCKMNFYFGGFK